MKTITVTINWKDKKQIKRAELRKQHLENNGYTLRETVSGIDRAILVYQEL